MQKFCAKVVSIGELVTEFTEAGILVFFGENAPDELKEFSIIHDGKSLAKPVAIGDRVKVAGHSYKVLAVGEVANTNFSNLGHFVMKANGAHEVEMPGDVCVEAKPLPQIEIGSEFLIES
jgi:PTS system glucitol/sorbitol-specific IIA component